MKVLVTGANGYIGTRLLPSLVEKGHEVVALVRSPDRLNIPEGYRSRIEIRVADLLDPSSLASAITPDLEAAYYLVHSMADSTGKFESLEEKCAKNFADALKGSQLKQLIYLGGLAEEGNLSPHMRSRTRTAEILRQSGIPCTTLKAGIVIGAGSASFEIIRDLVEKLPVMVAPKWVLSKCQPIAVYDVLGYLVDVLGHPDCLGQEFDIGGPDVLTYREMLYDFAALRGLKRWIILLPVLTPRLSSYWLFIITSTNYRLAQALVDSMKCDAIRRDTRIDQILPRKCLSYKEALEMTLQRIEQNEVVSSWRDALSGSRLSPDLENYYEIPKQGCMVDAIELPYEGDFDRVRRKIWSIGGDRGWYTMDWAWRLRGTLDKFAGGPGLRRGRTHPTKLKPGDALDFWRVVKADADRGHLLLFAEMKIPGEAWLEWKIEPYHEGGLLKQTATFRPKGVFGRLYWYSLVVFHDFIFTRMARAITDNWNSPLLRLSKAHRRWQMSTEIQGTADQLFRWHARQGAFERLTPPWEDIQLVQPLQQLRNGAHSEFRIKFGPFPLRWVADHRHVEPPHGFVDMQVEGPFSYWRHSHVMTEIKADKARLTDRIEYRLPGGSIVHRLFRPLVDRRLKRIFKYRHQVLQADFAQAAPKGRLRILVTDDQSKLCRSLIAYLRTQGHMVTRISRDFRDAKHAIYMEPEIRSVQSERMEGHDVVVHMSQDRATSQFLDKTLHELSRKPKHLLWIKHQETTGLNFSVPATELSIPPVVDYDVGTLGDTWVARDDLFYAIHSLINSENPPGKCAIDAGKQTRPFDGFEFTYPDRNALGRL